ncbi:Mo25-like protein, partial [Conidiobolus coronatus NRRL 28638]
FFDNYYDLILNSNYVIKRQSLKLLGEFLLDRINFKIMTLLMNEVNYLKLIMNCLKDPSKNIQWEAFHIFKIFVANPNKPENITKILKLNQLKLIEFLNSFFENRSEDEKFIDERDYIILQIQNL